MSKTGTLRVNIVGDSGPLQNTLKGTSSKIGGFAKNLAKVGVGAVVGFGSAAVGAAFKTASMGDEIAKTAPKLGVTTDELQEMAHWADRNGVSSSDMERAVGRLNQRIGDGTAGSSKYVDALNGMGVATLDMNGNVRDTSEVMGETIQALSEIESPAERSRKAADVFGTSLARNLMPALEDGSLSMEEAAQMAHEMGVVMDEDAIAASERFTDSWADIKDAGMAMLRDFGTPLMEWMANSLFPVIQDQVVPALQGFAEWIGPHLADAMEWIGGFFDEVLLPAFQSLSDWWDDNGPAIVAAAQELWEGLQSIFDTLTDYWNTVVGLFTSGGDDTEGVFASIQDFAEEVWPKIQGIIESAMDAINAVIERVTAIVQGIWDRWGEDILEFATTVWESIQKVIGGVLDVIQGLFETFAGLFSGDWERMWEGIKSIVSGVWDAILGLWDTLMGAIELALNVAWDTITELWDKLWTWVKDTASQAWDDLKESISDAIEDVLDFFRDLPGDMLDALGDLGRILFDAGREIIDGLWDGLKSMWENVTGWFSGLGSEIRNLKGPIEKDRVLLTDIGEEIIGGLGRGLDDEWRNVEKMLGAMTAEIPVSVSDANAATTASSGGPAGGMQPRQVVINIHGDVAGDLDEERLVELLNRSEVLAGVR